MNTPEVTLQVLPEYQLKLNFPNGSKATIDMKRRIQAVRFGRLSSPELFCTARLVGSEVVWGTGAHSIRASISELLDAMQLV